ncbi:hypothetical protein GCM10027446_01820 [Angustibacter peucedani]
MLALLVLGLLAGLVTGAAPASAASYTGSTSVWLYPGSVVNATGTRVSLGSVKVPSPGTYHADLSSRITDGSADSVQYVAVSLICKEETSIEDQVGAATNIVRGETRTLNARVYFSVKKRAVCFAYGATTRLKGSSASPSTRRLSARSTITVTGPVASATRETKRFVYDDANRGYSGRSFLAKPGAYTHTGEFATTDTPGSQAVVTGNVYLTTCSFQGGSRDQTTNGKDLCTAAVTRHVSTGSLVQVRLVVRQYSAGGTRVCGTTVVPGSTTQVRITATRHHLPVAVQGTATLLGADKGCGGPLHAWTEVRVISGPSTVVHFPSTVTAYRPI